MSAKRPRAGPGESGFTLLEILIALVVFGFVLAMLTQGVQFGLAAWRSQAQETTRRGDLDSVDRALRQLVGRMEPGVRITGTLVTGDAHAVAFTTEVPFSAEQLLTRRADVSLSVDPQHRFSLHWLPHFRNWIGPARVPSQATLADGVASVDISYWQNPDGETPGGWVTKWDGRNGPPGLVRFHITFADPRRHWPDIVIEPMRERPR